MTRTTRALLLFSGISVASQSAAVMTIFIIPIARQGAVMVEPNHPILYTEIAWGSIFTILGLIIMAIAIRGKE
jgi:di/tricarboxylate transporter